MKAIDKKNTIEHLEHRLEIEIEGLDITLIRSTHTTQTYAARSFDQLYLGTVTTERGCIKFETPSLYGIWTTVRVSWSDIRIITEK